jgi:hypothetical protein
MSPSPNPFVSEDMRNASSFQSAQFSLFLSPWSSPKLTTGGLLRDRHPDDTSPGSFSLFFFAIKKFQGAAEKGPEQPK